MCEGDTQLVSLTFSYSSDFWPGHIIEPGVPFVQAIEKAIGSVDLMIVLIGPGWLTIADDDGQPRIEKADDVVGQEVAWGLERQILVIPIRVGGADMPSEEQLPEGIRELAELNAHEMSDTRWDYDLGVLLERLARLPAGDAPVG